MGFLHAWSSGRPLFGKHLKRDIEFLLNIVKWFHYYVSYKGHVIIVWIEEFVELEDAMRTESRSSLYGKIIIKH